MNESLNPPCDSSLATSWIKSAIASSFGEGKLAALFFDGVSSSAEGELAIDETASTVILAPDLWVVPVLSVAVREEDECVGDFLDCLIGEEGAVSHLVSGGEADDNDELLDIISGITAVDGAEAEVWKFADALARAILSVETLEEGVVDKSHLPRC